MNKLVSIKEKQAIFFIFILILLIGGFFRFYQLASVPPSPSLDEVSIGYNAYSLLHTGKDEYGNFLPLLLRAYDDWRPALYVYLVIPFTAFLGLSVLSVRVPSVILSLLTVAGTYFLVKEIFYQFKYKNIVALIAMFLLAISPWHIYISRLGHEVNAGSTCVVLGTTFFFLAIHHRKNQKRNLFLSVILYMLSFYTYQSEKGFTPLLVLGLCFLFWKEIRKIENKTLFQVAAMGILLLVPILSVTFTAQGLARLKGTSAFTNIDSAYQTSAKQLIKDRNTNNIVGQIIDNRRLVPVRIFLTNYFSHFNPYWLYGNKSVTEDFKAPYMGLFYFWEFPFLLLGFFFLIKYKEQKTLFLFLLFWIGASFIPPSVSTQAPHAMRSFNLLPIPQCIEAFGICSVFFLIKHPKFFLLRLQQISFFLIAAVFVGWSFVYFYFNYFLLFPAMESRSFQYALSTAYDYLLHVAPSSRTIVISNKDNLYQSYMFYLFQSAYDPKKYLHQGGTKSGGFAQTHVIENIQFRSIDWNTEKKEQHTLFIGNPDDFPKNVQVLLKAPYLNGVEGVWIVQT